MLLGSQAAVCSSLDSDAPDSAFCIIESRESVKVRCELARARSQNATPAWSHMQDFARLQLAEINQAILKRRNRIFLLMEEVRRLRVQQRVKVCTALLRAGWQPPRDNEQMLETQEALCDGPADPGTGRAAQ